MPKLLPVFTVYLFLFSTLFSGCHNDPPTPRPRAFPKVEYPEKNYQTFDQSYCNFTFQYPAYAEIVQDTSFFDGDPLHPCWFDIYVPQFDSRLHCSYYPIGGEKDFATLKKDAFELADYHIRKANYIDEIRIEKPNDVSGFAFGIEGPAASPFQFYLTDSTDHFLRASLYFNTAARPDSLRPVYEFLRRDIEKMIETFEWVE